MALPWAEPTLTLSAHWGAPPKNRAGYIDWQVRSARAVGSPEFEFDAAVRADRAARVYDRGRDDTGMMRQLVTVPASGDRAQLRALRVPTLVLHGAADLMRDASGGERPPTPSPKRNSS
ncbi:hypothetical protein AB0C34_06700 [Nocardia sp. NPDC049220]|uniref:alpha/beta fold hydrolase n=1 Tax=Nocardia sp. NPDC049220 TaxID=3155273 RepID=UPI0033CEF924